MRSPLVVALNPSVDAEWCLDHVRPEEKNTIRSVRRWPGGKGVNVARWLLHFGMQSPLLLPLGGSPGREMSSGLRRWNIPTREVPIESDSRVNVIVTPDTGPQLRFNEPGPRLHASDWRALQAKLRPALRGRSALVLSGSLPRGVPVGAYAAFIRRASRFGVRSILDCEGPALAAAIPAHPFLVKPNEYELAAWVGKPLRTDASLRDAALALSERTRGWVFVSRGARGALLVNHDLDTTLSVQPPPVKVLNTVGAGDAMLAAVTWRLTLAEPPEFWLRWGVAAGTIMTSHPAGHLPTTGAISRLARRLKCTD